MRLLALVVGNLLDNAIKHNRDGGWVKLRAVRWHRADRRRARPWAGDRRDGHPRAPRPAEDRAGQGGRPTSRSEPPARRICPPPVLQDAPAHASPGAPHGAAPAVDARCTKKPRTRAPARTSRDGVDLTGQYSNPSGPLKLLLEAVSAGDGHRRPVTPSRYLPPGLRLGAIKRAIRSVLGEPTGRWAPEMSTPRSKSAWSAPCRTRTFARSYPLQRVIRQAASLESNEDGRNSRRVADAPAVRPHRGCDPEADPAARRPVVTGPSGRRATSPVMTGESRR
jgi:hypothetical protein